MSIGNRDHTRCLYGLLGYSTMNLGDDIQSLAVQQFLPRTDFIIDRDFLSTLDLRVPAKMVLNGWFCHHFRQFEGRHVLDRIGLAESDSSLLQLLVTSFNCDFIVSGRDMAFGGQVLQFLQRHQPIGCRDSRTAEVLADRGIEAYFSGCMTLLLRPRQTESREGVLDIDSRLNVEAALGASGPRQVQKATQFVDRQTPFGRRFELASLRLWQIERSELVVTSRLHVALPAIAMNVPVVFTSTNIAARYRVEDYIELFDYVVHSQEELTAVLNSPIVCKPKPSLAPIQQALRSSLESFLATDDSST